ncbi:hypothetical protein Tco_0487114 [Tanacetum coccineum]
MVYFVDGVLASGVEIILEMDFVRFALQELEIHSFMIQIRTLSMILQTFSTTLHSPRHTRVSYVGTILTMVMIVHHGYRLSMSRNRATIKTLCQPRNQNFYEPNLCYNSNSSGFDQPPQYSIDHQPQSIQEDLKELIKSHKDELFKTMQSVVEMFRQREQAANLSTHTPEPSRRFNSICYDDDDDEESTIPLNEIISQIPPSIAITPVLPTMEPEDSLIMGDEDLRTIPKKESDKVIKSSVEDLIPIPSESEETSDNDSECDFPFCEDSSPLDVLGGNSVIFSNPLFDSNDNFTSSDDESFPDEDVQEENFKTYSNPLFEFDDKYISSDVNPLFNEVLEDIESKDSYVSNLDEQALLVTHLSELNEDECFDPGGDEIEACLTSDSIFLRILKMASEDVVNRKSSSCSVICYTSSHSPCILQQLCLQGVLTPVRGESSEILNGFDVSLLVAIISGVVSLCPSEGVCLVNETHFYSHYLNIGLVNPLAPREKCQPSNIGFAIRLLPKAIIL